MFDVIIVGSGINSLVCAALLARSKRKVLLLEREATLGGCIRTDELTLPGFFHDTLSTAHPLFMVGPAYAALGPALHEAGLEYCNTASPTAVLLADNRHLVLTTSPEKNVAAFESAHQGDGHAYDAALRHVQENAALVFGLLGNELWRWRTLGTVVGAAWKQGPGNVAGFVGQSLTPASGWLRNTFKSELTRALLAPWVLHCGLSPDAPLSSLMAQVVAMTLQGVGLPIVKGGNANTVRAFQRVIQDAGGVIETRADVMKVLIEQGRAVGVALTDGREFRGNDVVCNVTPTQLYGRLVDAEATPDAIRAEAESWRYGKGNMQIHLALSEAPEWSVSELRDVGYVHLCEGPEAVSRAVNEAERGVLPAHPTICVAQPTVLDPSRAPPGKHILWIQLPECPRSPTEDALGECSEPLTGQWTEALREAYADRIVDTLSRHIPNLHRIILGRAVLSPADLESLNINLVGGDPYGGDCSLDQSFLWRPSRINRNHRTAVRGLWHIGASTHPGPGLGGTSGFHVATALGAT